MNVTIEDICRYLDFMIEQGSYYITLHGDFITIPELIRYNIHLNPYCHHIKTTCGSWEECIKKQCNVLEKCREGEFYGICYAGVGEYVYPVTLAGKVHGFISFGSFKGRNEKMALEKLRHFATKNHLNTDILLKIRDDCLIEPVPKRCSVDTIIRPLVFMLESYLEKTSQLGSDSTDLYSSVLRYINTNHTMPLSMKNLAAHYNCSVSTLSHLFKKNCGMSISRYIQKLRIEDAKMLLCHSNIPVTEISYNLGFCNPAYFSEVFKKYTGLSPKEYRKLSGTT